MKMIYIFLFLILVFTSSTYAVQIIKPKMTEQYIKYTIDKTYPIERANDYCFKTLIPNGTLLSNVYKDLKEEDKDLFLSSKLPLYVDDIKLNYSFDRENIICHNLVNGIYKWGFNSSIVEVGNLSLGVFNNTVYQNSVINLTAVNVNGTYTSEVFNFTTSYNTTNLTINSYSWSGYEVEGSLITYRNNPVFWVNFETYNDFDDIINDVPELEADSELDDLNYLRDGYIGDALLCNETGGGFDRLAYDWGTYPFIFNQWNGTLEFWIAPYNSSTSDWTSDDNYIFRATFLNQTDCQFYVNYDATADYRLEVSFHDGTSWHFNEISYYWNASQMEWHHIAVSWNNETSKTLYYIDGVNVENGTFYTYDKYCQPARVYFARKDSRVVNDYWLFDEVKIFNYSRDSEQIYDDYEDYINAFNLYQTYSNGVDTHNFSIDKSANFVQAKMKMYANTTDTDLIYNFNLTMYNISYGGSTPTNITPINLPTWIETEVGTYSGNQTNTYVIDGINYTVVEIIETPAFLVNITFDYLSLANRLKIYGWYEGNPAHYVDVGILYDSNNTLLVLGQLPDVNQIGWYNFTISNMSLFNSTGRVTVIINHTSSGSANHYLHLDYMALNYTAPCVSSYGNTSWTPLINFSSCFSNFTIFQGHNTTQYDINNCVGNTTIWNYTYGSCIYNGVASTDCRYKKLGYYNTQLMWLWEENCV